MCYKTIIIDDSSIQRLATTILVKNHPKLELLGAYEDPFEGIKAVKEQEADILFLDVLMGNINAFELLDRVQISSAIIINSTWRHFETKAKTYGIFEFLLKPMPKSDFLCVVKSVIQKLETEKSEIFVQDQCA